GTLAYVAGVGGTAATQRTLVWVDREGRETPIPAPPRAYATPRLSPDGTRVAVHAADQEQDIWVWDFARATLTRLTFEPSTDLNPTWMPDGRRLIFSSNRDAGARGGIQTLYMQSADGTGTVTRLSDGVSVNPQGITADGTRLVLHVVTQTRQRDLAMMTI